MAKIAASSSHTPDTRQVEFDAPSRWQRGGLVLPRSGGGVGAGVMGDPCIVWDETISGWRMVLFCAPPGHAQAICRSATEVGPGNWEFLGPLQFTNPDAAPNGTTHKPYILQEAHRPNHAAKIDGRYMLVSVGHLQNWKHKYVHRAWAEQLAGPWTWDPQPLIPPGGPGDFDEKHTDAVSGLYFPQRRECVYFYMGYPQSRQPRRISPYGSAQGVAMESLDHLGTVRKLGIILPPQQCRGHWASGYVGGLQPVPGRRHRWVAMANASPTAPIPDQDQSISREEPPPSLGGFAFTDEEYPISGWQWSEEPLEWIEDIPPQAVANGEGVNLWRHHLLILPDGRAAVFYNSGSYGKEQLYMKWAL